MRATWSAIAAVVLNAGVVWADPPADERAMAEAEAAYEAQRYEEAIRRYRTLYEATHDVQALGRLAQAEQAAGAWLDAWTHYRAVLDTPDSEWVAARRARIEAQLQTVASHLGTLSVTVLPADATVRLNGTPQRGNLSQIRVAEGRHSLVVSAEGFVFVERRVEVDAGMVLSVQVFLERNTPPNFAQTPLRLRSTRAYVETDDARLRRLIARDPGLSYRRAAVYLSIAGALLAIGGVSLGLAIDAAHDFEANPSCGRNGDQITGGEACESLNTRRGVGTAFAVWPLLLSVPAIITGVVAAVEVRSRRRTVEAAQRASIRWTNGSGDLGIGLAATF